MTATAEARRAISPIINSRQIKRLSRSVRHRRKPLYQAVFVPLPVIVGTDAAVFDCIKDGVFIDPPYNTGNDFVYADDFADPLARYKEITQQTTKSNPEAMGRFHTNWLNMMYPRLRLAANLLRDDGVIFISIDDNEVHNLRKLCDMVFGEENFVTQIVWNKRVSPARDARFFSTDHEYVIIYAKNLNCLSTNNLPRNEKNNSYYKNPDNDPRGAWNSAAYTCNKTRAERPNLYYPIVNPHTGEEIYPRESAVWAYSQETHQKHIADNILYWGGDGKAAQPRKKAYLFEVGDVIPRSVWNHSDVGSTQKATMDSDEMFGSKIFPYPKPPSVIEQMLRIGTDKDSIILDFFSGSATTAHAVMQLNAEDGGNRKFILVQLPELADEKSESYKAGYKNICEIGKERIRRAGEMIKQDDDKWKSVPLNRNDDSKIGDQTSVNIVDVIDYNDGKPPVEFVDVSKNPDTGFKVFKLDTSNLKLWDDSPIVGENAIAELEARLQGMLDIIKTDRSNMDVVYEVMLKLGQQLTQPVIPIDLGNGKVVYGVGSGKGSEVKFIVCLAYGITPEDAEAMAEYAPGRIVFADSCFDNSEQKSNVRLTLKDKGIAIKAL